MARYLHVWSLRPLKLRSSMKLTLRRASVSRHPGPGMVTTSTCSMASAQSGASSASMPRPSFGGWGVSFMLTGRKGYGIAETREEAMAAFFYPSEKTSLTDTKSARNPITTALLTD